MQYYISRLRIKSFKSIGEEVIQVEFQPGLNAIVGSNGAGKSTLLEAVRFAFAAPTKSFGGNLESLRNSSATGEVCEVEVALKRRNGGPSSKGAAQVTVCATLTPDNTRSYRLQGRIASGLEVKKHLRSMGINMEAPSSLIKQDAVTQLADAEDPFLLSAVVSEISGLGTWLAETGAANLEIQRNNRDAEVIQQRIAQLRLQGGVAQEEIQLAERRHMLEEALAKEAAKMHALAERTDTQASLELDEAQKVRKASAQNIQQLEDRLSTATKRLADLESHSNMPSDTQGFGTEEDHAICMERVSIEEEISLVNENIRKQTELQEALETAQQDQRKAATSHSLAAVELSAAKEAYAAANAVNQRHSADASESLAEGISHRVRTLETALGQAQSKLDAARERLVAAQSTLDQLPPQGDEDTLMKDLSDIFLTGSVQQDEAEVERLEQDIADLEWKERSARQRSHAATRVLPAANLDIPPGMKPLHACFEFKNASDCAKYATALEALVGKRLGVIIAPTAESAVRLAASPQGAGLRLWPLDMLVFTDRLQRHRQAAAAFAPGAVIIPLDLVTSSDAKYKSVLTRALGAHVIASTPEVAADLIERFGVPSVGLDGSVSSRGRLTGGWLAERQAQGPLHAKLQADYERQVLSKLRNELREIAAKANKMRHAIAQYKDAAAVKEAAAAHAEQRRVAQSNVNKAQAVVEEAEKAIHSIQAELVPQQALLKAALASAGTAPAEFQAALQAESNRLSHRIQSLTGKLTALEGTRTTAEATILSVQGKVAAADVIASWQQRVLELGARLRGLQRQALDAAQAAVDSRAAESAVRTDEFERVGKEVSGLQSALLNERNEADRLALRCKELEDVSHYIDQLTLAAAAEEFHGRRLHQSMVDMEENLAMSLAELLEAVESSQERYANLGIELEECISRSAGAAINVAEQRARAEIVQRLVDGLTEKCRVNQKTADTLTEGMISIAPAIVRMNEGVFDRARIIFQGLVNQALPGVEVDVVRVGEYLVQEGVVFRHRLAHAGEWREGLASLSGGQRSIVCLAFILATRTAGSGQGAGVLLVDEVDAALDTGNQHLAATLMRSMCSNSTAGSSTPSRSTQVIAVSHNPAFQQVCDHVVKITRGAHGTRVEGNGAAGGTSKGTGIGNGKRRKK